MRTVLTLWEKTLPEYVGREFYRFTLNPDSSETVDNMSVGHGRAITGTFPPIFGPYHRTEMLAALLTHGPIRAPILKKCFGGESGRSISRPKSNAAKLLQALPIPHGRGRSAIVGMNPNSPVRSEIENLLRALMREYTLRQIPVDTRPEEVEVFLSSVHPEVDLNAMFGTTTRTHMLVALHVLGGVETTGKLQRSVLAHFKSLVERGIFGYVEEGILVKNGPIVRFNEDLKWLPELRLLLDALASRMPNLVAHALELKDERDRSRSKTSHSHGLRFRIFGSRGNQAILAFLAANGPSRTMQIAAAANLTMTTVALEPLLRSGIISYREIRDCGKKDRYSLNAAFPVYRELRALLRTPAVLNEALPLYDIHELYEGEDFSDAREEFLPYTLFGVENKIAITNVLAVLGNTPGQEISVPDLVRVLNEHDAKSFRKAMNRLAAYGIIEVTGDGKPRRYRLNREWPAYNELSALLHAMADVWEEYRYIN